MGTPVNGPMNVHQPEPGFRVGVTGRAAPPRAGRPRSTKRLPLIAWVGRCPNCRCTRIVRHQEWGEASILGWTVGICRDGTS